jgi:hypothetical protein
MINVILTFTIAKIYDFICDFRLSNRNSEIQKFIRQS